MGFELRYQRIYIGSINSHRPHLIDIEGKPFLCSCDLNDWKAGGVPDGQLVEDVRVVRREGVGVVEGVDVRGGVGRSREGRRRRTGPLDLLAGGVGRIRVGREVVVKRDVLAEDDDNVLDGCGSGRRRLRGQRGSDTSCRSHSEAQGARCGRGTDAELRHRLCFLEADVAQRSASVANFPTLTLWRVELQRSKAPEEVDCYILDLIRHRDISNKIAQEYDVYHESPQVLLIKNGECVYDESHYGITMDAIIEQV